MLPPTAPVVPPMSETTKVAIAVIRTGLAGSMLRASIQAAEMAAPPRFPYPVQVSDGYEPKYSTITGPVPTSVRELLAVEHLPYLLRRAFKLAMQGGLSPAEAAALAPRLWFRCAPRPAMAAPADEWLALWRAGGYSDSGVEAERPTAPITLYRGSMPEHARGWCWSQSRPYARLVASQQGGRGLWQSSVAPGALLGRFPGGEADPRSIGAQILARQMGLTTGLDACDEWVVDPSMLGEVHAWTDEEISSTPVLVRGQGAILGRVARTPLDGISAMFSGGQRRGHGVW